MAWTRPSVARAGQYLYARTVAGFSSDLFGTISQTELEERLRGYLTQADLLQVQTVRDLFTFDVSVLARARADLPLDMFEQQVGQALESFWTIAGVMVNAWASDNAADPLPAPGGGEIGSTVRWVAIAAIAAAIAIVIVQIRKGVS